MSNEKQNPPYRQSLLNQEQKEKVKDWISQQNVEMTPPTMDDLTDFVRNTLSIECSNTWVNKWIEANSSEIFLVDASPLEKERMDVTPE